MKIRKIVAGFLASLLLAAIMQGCNTMRGLGRDIEKTGEVIQDATK